MLDCSSAQLLRPEPQKTKLGVRIEKRAWLYIVIQKYLVHPEKILIVVTYSVLSSFPTFAFEHVSQIKVDEEVRMRTRTFVTFATSIWRKIGGCAVWTLKTVKEETALRQFLFCFFSPTSESGKFTILPFLCITCHVHLNLIKIIEKVVYPRWDSNPQSPV